MAASYRTQARHLTRAVVAASLVVAEATLRDPSRVILVQLERSLARVRDQEQKCAGICEDIRDAQEQSEANETHIEASCTRDATRANVAGVAIMQQMARYEIGLRPPAVGAQGPVGPGPAQRIICKPEKDLKTPRAHSRHDPGRICVLGRCVRSISCRQPYGGSIHCSAAGVF
jgi:hypothetical protein